MNPFRKAAAETHNGKLARSRWYVEPFALRAATLGCGWTCLFRIIAGQPWGMSILSSLITFLIVCVLGLRRGRA